MYIYADATAWQADAEAAKLQDILHAGAGAGGGGGGGGDKPASSASAGAVEEGAAEAAEAREELARLRGLVAAGTHELKARMSGEHVTLLVCVVS